MTAPLVGSKAGGALDRKKPAPLVGSEAGDVLEVKTPSPWSTSQAGCTLRLTKEASMLILIIPRFGGRHF